MQGPAPIMGENDVDDERSVESYNMLMEVLQASNIEDDEEAVMVTRMAVDPRHVKEFERILRLILKNTHTVGHVSTCVVKPARGEYTYTSIVKYASLSAMRQIFPSSENGGLDFYKLFAARDSLLVEPPTYQIEAGFGTWIESDGNTRPMRDDNDDNMVYNTIPKPCCDDSCDNPHGLNVRASFIAPTKNFQLFQPRYQRNNKKGGQKNLRCFPCCRNGRHVSSGFCGDSIRVHVAVSRITESGGIKICPISSTAPAVLAYARFLNLEGAFDPMVSGPEVFPGQTIEKYELSQYVRDKDHPLNPLFPGILRGAAMESTLQSATFEFNAECKAWHYGWTAPRGQGLSGSDAQHVLEILFLKPMGSYLFCLERLRSDTFSIYSSRRASHATVKPEAEVYENDEEVEDERGQKRKRAMAPASPAPSTMSSYSSGSASATSSPHAGNHHQYHPHVHGQSQTHASAWSVLNRPSPSHKTSNVGTAQLQHAMEEVTFKVEPMPPLSQSPSSRHDHHHHGHSHNHGHAHHQRPHQQRPMFVGENLDMLFQPPAPQSTMNHGYHHQNSAMGDTHMLPESGDLVDHMLFADDQHERRVVSSEELPWAELYNLFDNVPMNSPSAASDDASSNNDMDDESPVSSPTPSSDSATCTTSSAGAAAILTYL